MTMIEPQNIFYFNYIKPMATYSSALKPNAASKWCWWFDKRFDKRWNPFYLWFFSHYLNQMKNILAEIQFHIMTITNFGMLCRYHDTFVS